MAGNPVRVRLAPSPTGEVHIGTMWIAQFNWLFAKQRAGAFVLRIEDTDQQRLVPGSADRLYEALEWYGWIPDESPRRGGLYGPYQQSERLATYQQYARQLVEKGSAYYCFCSAQRLTELRDRQTAGKQPPRYDKLCLQIPAAEAMARVNTGESHVIRLNVPASGMIVHDDLIRGPVSFALNQVDDSVLMKSDGFPTYHLAVVVDDYLMKISHVIRAEEWLPSVPKHLLLYRALQWPTPIFAHLPLILGKDRAKLSKRHGASSALSFRDQGYLPEAMRNFLALMGWHPKGDNELLSTEQLLAQFRLEDIHPSGAVFDETKLIWLNGVYIRQLSAVELLARVRPFWSVPEPFTKNDQHLLAILALVVDRLKRLSEINELTQYLFPSGWDEALKTVSPGIFVPKKGTAEKTLSNLQWATHWLARAKHFEEVSLRQDMLVAIKEEGKKNLDVLWPLRVALTTKAASPDVFAVAALLGRDETMRRIEIVLKLPIPNQ